MTPSNDAPTTPAAARKAPVSCCIRTLNEGARISEVIAAAQRVADEVVVVDSGSTDETMTIARSLGAVVVEQPWLGWGGQKRVGEDTARHPWILDIDADEVMSPKLADEVAALFAKGEPPLPVYSLLLITAPPIGEPWYDFLHTRRNKLYDKRVIRSPDHRAWDQFTVPDGMKVGRLNGPLLHYSFRDLEHFAAKANGASTSRAKDSKLKARWVVVLRVLLGPPFYFFKHYVMRQLWRAGLYGFIIAALSAHGRWLRDCKMYEIYLGRDGARRGN